MILRMEVGTMKVKLQTHQKTKGIKNLLLLICFAMLAFNNGCGTDKPTNQHEISNINENADTQDGFDTDDIVSRHESSDTNGIVENYYEMSDGTWKADGITYKYRLGLKGTMPGAAGESHFVVLTNNKDISFDEVAKSIFSSDSNDWLDRSQTIIVEMY